VKVPDRVATGIEGFDVLVQGGFPHQTINLVSGPAGSGKSLFALQFCFNGASQYHEPSMYIVLEETKANLERAMKAFGMDGGPHVRSSRFLLIDLGELRVAGSENSSIGFDELREFLASSLKTANVRRLAIDSLSAIGLHYANPEQFRERLFAFCRFLRDQDVTTLLLSESPDGHTMTRYGVEQFVTDSFVHLGLEEVKGELRRTLTVRKMRFTRHDTAKHPFHISSSGLTVAADEKVV